MIHNLTEVIICTIIDILFFVVFFVVDVMVWKRKRGKAFDKDIYILQLVNDKMKVFLWSIIFLFIVLFTISFLFDVNQLVELRYVILALLVLLIPIIIISSRYRIVVDNGGIVFTPRIGKKVIFKFSDITTVVVKKVKYSGNDLMLLRYDVYAGDEKLLWINERVDNRRLFTESLLKYNVYIVDEQGNVYRRGNTYERDYVYKKGNISFFIR